MSSRRIVHSRVFESMRVVPTGDALNEWEYKLAQNIADKLILLADHELPQDTGEILRNDLAEIAQQLFAIFEKGETVSPALLGLLERLAWGGYGEKTKEDVNLLKSRVGIV